MARFGRSCIFCGSGRALPAAVLPAWLDDCLTDFTLARGRATLTCRACSDGWLADLQRHSMPLLRELIGGRPLVLDRHNQAMLATWSSAAVLTLERARGRATFPPAVHRDLYEQRRPPTGFRFEFGQRPRGNGWPVRYGAIATAAERRPGEVEPTYPGMAVGQFLATLEIGHLVIRADARFAPGERAAHAGPLLQVWPPGAPARWPAAASATAAGTAAAAQVA